MEVYYINLFCINYLLKMMTIKTINQYLLRNYGFVLNQVVFSFETIKARLLTLMLVVISSFYVFAVGCI